MRAFCTVSAPLEVCASSAEQLSPGSRFLALRLLGNQQPKTLYFLVDAKSRVREVYTQTCLHFATQGMLDTELFGLAVLIDGEYMFADPESKLSKYGPKSWRSSHTHGLDANGRPLLELHFRVQFYIESPFMLKDETTRHNYYLQLKYNALQRDIPREYAEQSMILLAGLALQADLGDAPTSGGGNNNNGGGNNNNGGTGGDCKTSSDSGQGDNTTKQDNGEAKGNKTGTSSSTTTLPKISKRANMVNERVLRLSSYMASSSRDHPSATGMDGLKRIIGSSAVKSPLSPSSSSASSISRGPSNASTNASTVSTNASSSCADYFRLEDYLPEHLRTAWAASALRACHRENRGLSQADAELHYIQQACLVNECINAHTFRMRMSKNELGPGNSWFVVYAKGIKIFGGATGPDGQQQQITFLWPNITKLSFERKKFEIRSGESKITLFATSDEKNKMLLTLCKETHQFSMKIAARLKEVIKREEEESNCLHACYVYSRSLHLPTYKNKSDQRISVISSTSSNTTSGIVSDRVHSEDELEIMINSPPAPIAAPSTESLALAHLLDRPSVSRQTSSVGQVSLKDLEEQLAALTVRQAQKQRESPTELSNTSSAGNSTSTSGSSLPVPMAAGSQRNNTDSSTDSPSSQHNIGSQCSSTCSTVVVASSTANDNNNSLATLAVRSSVLNSSDSNSPHHHHHHHQRKNSTSSSLELGFSHTAQNSTLSEPESTCIDHDFIAASSNQDENESVSGVYTLAHAVAPTETSGVYTMHSSEMTGQSSEMAESEKSSHYGIFQPASGSGSEVKHKLQDSVDGGGGGHSGVGEASAGGLGGLATYRGKRLKNSDFRLRSDSNVSTSDSFRGDGSDPTDNKHSLLSAEELTELIVGRGSYPNRKTVSNTLDSDCDYVTLPLSMSGESYIQGHQDTAPTEDHVEDLISDLLPTDPPAPPKRVDSNIPSLSNIQMRSPPPYNARHKTTGLCGPPIRSTTTTTTTTSTLNSGGTTSTTLPPAVAPPPPLASGKTTSTMGAPAGPTVIKRRNPPPYPLATKPRPTSLISVASSSSSLNQAPANGYPNVGGSMTSLKSEEITARFITTRPQINILKAHTSVVNENPKPSYAAPTNCSSAASSTGSVCSHHLPSHLSQLSVPNSNYVSGSQASLNMQLHAASTPTTPTHSSTMSVTSMGHQAGGGLPNSLSGGMPALHHPYSLHGGHKSMSSLHHHHHHHHQQQPPPPPPPYPSELKQPTPRTCVLLPVIKPRQYLPPPPPSLPRQPPPPPPTQLASLYTTANPLAHKQLELYQQQLYSDVDYVIYPLQDPAVSQQEYLDAKQGSMLAAMAQSPPPPPPSHAAHHHHHPYLAAAAYHHHAAAAAAVSHHHHQAYEACKGHAIYRSTPYLPLALTTHSRYASTQNLSDTYVQLPSAAAAYSPMYSPSMASICSSYEPPPPPPLHPGAVTVSAGSTSTASLFGRSRSDDNILNTLDSLPKVKRLPPPPPPPYVDRRLKKPPMPTPTEKPPPIPSKPSPLSQTTSNLNLATAGQQQHLQQDSMSAFRSSQLPPRKPITLSVPRGINSHMTKTSSGAQWAGERPKHDLLLGRCQESNIIAQLQASVQAAKQQASRTALAASQSNGVATSISSGGGGGAGGQTPPSEFDIALLREKSKHLDLPLISALCNDRSLLKQTKVLTPTNNNKGSKPATSKDSGGGSSGSTSSTPPGSSLEINGNINASTGAGNNNNTPPAASSTTSVAKALTNNTSSTSTSVPTGQLTKTRKTSIPHRHPNDKLPPLPMQLAEANNYVMDPAAVLKHHKSYNSHT
ncbi:protein expanded [Musca vetustissima]|uniref:protein expanded n=1 Tax=Musca vetustissima TaxID=27455 RepID=UPI002AB6DACE|nr:protein expanded [Musca vetustissima]